LAGRRTGRDGRRPLALSGLAHTCAHVAMHRRLSAVIPATPSQTDPPLHEAANPVGASFAREEGMAKPRNLLEYPQ
jgi:hypothetical protein